jgi:hypothetical protein
MIAGVLAASHLWVCPVQAQVAPPREVEAYEFEASELAPLETRDNLLGGRFLDPDEALLKGDFGQRKDYPTPTDARPGLGPGEPDWFSPSELETMDDLDLKDPRTYAREFSDDYFSRQYYHSGEYLRSAFGPPDEGDDGLEYSYDDFDYHDAVELEEEEEQYHLDFWWEDDES